MTPDEFAAAANVSRETLNRLLEMDRVLMEWSSRHNLIARSTIEERWRRHYLDSAQIAPLLPPGIRRLVDLGSGAGFPGLVLAAMLAEKDVGVTLIESTGKKAAFLAAAGEAMGLSSLKVIPARIESVRLPAPPDVVTARALPMARLLTRRLARLYHCRLFYGNGTARALARLDKLLGYAHGIAGKSTRFFLPKGQDVEAELTEAAKSWHMEVIRHPSLTSPDATIVEIGNLARVRKR